MAADEITPEIARGLLALPRTVGVHPDTGKRILAGIGRYGAWAQARQRLHRAARRRGRAGRRPQPRRGAGGREGRPVSARDRPGMRVRSRRHNAHARAITRRAGATAEADRLAGGAGGGV